MLRVGRGRRRRFRGVASQITLLVSIPLIVLLTLAAAGSLWLNWNSRLQNVSEANSDLALAAATAARAIKLEAAEALMRSDPLYEAPDPFTAVVRFGRGSSRELRGLLPRLVDGAAEEVRRISLTGPNETNVSGPLIESDTGYVSIIIAAGNAEGTVTAGLVQVAPDVLGVAWREFVEDRLPEPRDVDVGLVDASGVLLYHSISERVGGNLAGGSDGEGEVSAVGADVRSHFEGGEAITSIEAVGGRWFVMLQRPWSDWREGLNGPGLPVVVLLGAAALVTTSLLTLSASRLTRPLRELASASRAIAAGNFAARAPSIRTGDELEVLADQFDIMRTDLESLYTGLEKRVASRTAELVTVVELAGEVSRTLEAGEIARIAERGLREHPGVEDAAVWLPERTADLAGYQADLPEWVDAEALGKVGGTGEEGGREEGPGKRGCGCWGCRWETRTRCWRWRAGRRPTRRSGRSWRRWRRTSR